MLEEWNARLSAALGVDITVDTEQVLSLAADAAHNVVRPAAPLTTYLVGYAAALNGGTPEAFAEAVEKARALALSWETGSTE
jgi:hypothetical protein